MQDNHEILTEAEIRSALNDLLSEAVAEAHELSKKGPLVDVCGPYTSGGFGDETKNIEALDYARDVLEARGENVFPGPKYDRLIDQIRASRENPDEYFEEAVRLFWKPFYEKGLIKRVYFLPNWKSSKGAQEEFSFLQMLGIICRIMKERELPKLSF